MKEGQNNIYHVTAFSSLVGRNVALSFGCVLARGWVNAFLVAFFGVLSFVVGLLLSLLSHLAHSILTLDSLRTHLARWTAKSARHTCSFTYMSHRSYLFCVVEDLQKWCPVFCLVVEPIGHRQVDFEILVGDYDVVLWTWHWCALHWR